MLFLFDILIDIFYTNCYDLLVKTTIFHIFVVLKNAREIL